MPERKPHRRYLGGNASRAHTHVTRQLGDLVEELAYRLAVSESSGIPEGVREDHIHRAAAFVFDRIDPGLQKRDRSTSTIDIPRLADDLSEVIARLQRLEQLVAPIPAETHDGRPWVFISYARGVNDDMANSIATDLRDARLNVFLDTQSTPGFEWLAAIGKGIARARAVLVIVSADYRNSYYCNAEAVCALLLQKYVLPALHGLSPQDLPEYLKHVGSCRLGTPEQQRQVVETVRKACGC